MRVVALLAAVGPALSIAHTAAHLRHQQLSSALHKAEAAALLAAADTEACRAHFRL